MKIEIKKELVIIILVCIVVFLLSAVGIYKCPMQSLLGIPCVTCGMTRAILALLSLDIKGAFHYHALWPLILIAILIFLLYELKIINIEKKKANILLWIFAIILVIYNIIRIIILKI